MIDVITLLTCLWGFYQGFTKGIIKTVFTVFSIVFGLMAAFKLAPAATRFLETALHSDSPLNFIAGFLLTFVLTMIIIRTIARFIEGVLQSAQINIINKMAGGALLASLYTLIFAVLVNFGESAHIVTKEQTDKSYTYPFLTVLPDKMKGVYEYIKPGFQEFWQESVKFMDRMQEKSIETKDNQPTIFDLPDEEEETPKEGS